MKKALEELVKALDSEDLVEELVEDQQSQQLPVGYVHEVAEPQGLRRYSRREGVPARSITVALAIAAAIQQSWT